MIIDTIVAHKRAELEARWPDRNQEIPGGLPGSDRSLEQALRAPHTGFILECKKASPSKGLLRPDFDPWAIARAYAPVADAVSVLTDERFFQGSLDYLQVVRDAVSVPVLCKDFVLEPFQVVQARRYGADAVLLMMRVLDDDAFSRCFDTACALGMDALVEVHDETELERALRLGARIIGINNRNFSDLSVDLETVPRLARRVPADRVVVAESGYYTHAQVRAAAPLVDGFLVGSSLMEQPDLTVACNTLVYGRVKVCGITLPDQAAALAQWGASLGGVIFADRSARKVSRSQAEAVAAAASVPLVGVFADAPPEDVAAVADALGLAAVQLHGNETPEYARALRRLLPEECAVWKALSVGDKLPDWSAFAGCRILLDTGSGGSGRSFDWSLLESVNRSELVLAGGIGPDNAAEAARLDPWAIDINSKVESAPGHKDVDKVRRVMHTLRGPGRLGNGGRS